MLILYRFNSVIYSYINHFTVIFLSFSTKNALNGSLHFQVQAQLKIMFTVIIIFTSALPEFKLSYLNNNINNKVFFNCLLLPCSYLNRQGWIGHLAYHFPSGQMPLSYFFFLSDRPLTLREAGVFLRVPFSLTRSRCHVKRVSAENRFSLAWMPDELSPAHNIVCWGSSVWPRSVEEKLMLA